MSDLIIKKNGTDYKLPMLPEHYPADRVYLHGDIEKNVEWGMGEKTTLCTIMSAETVFNMTQASVNYAVQHSGFYCITVVNANNVTHDSDINIGGVAIASQYFTYHYQRYTALIPLKAGTQITINGTIGDGVIINYGWGNM